MEGGQSVIPATPHDTEDSHDWALIRRIGMGDQPAFEQLYQRYYDYLFRFIYQTTRRLDLVEEVINDVMFVVWQKAAEAEPRALAATWILSIAYNKARKSLAKERVTVHAGIDDEDPMFTDHGVMVETLEIENLLFVALKSLPPDHRAALELVYYHGLHYSQIAEVMGCPENTVKTRVFHARKKLRAIWPRLTGGKSPGEN